MIASLLTLPVDAVPRVLLLGAHCDDIEIGCGGTLQVLAERYPGLELRWTVFSSPAGRGEETKRAVEMLLPKGTAIEFDIAGFRESYFPYIGAEIKDYVESLKGKFSPDLIFTHFAEDEHQDHRLISELTRNAYRDHLILEYEVAKYDGDLGSPNVFVAIRPEQADKKVRSLMAAFASQRQKHWFTPEAFTSLMRLRGIESNSPGGLAEAFHCRKLRLFQ